MRRQFETTKGKFLRELELWLEHGNKGTNSDLARMCRFDASVDVPNGTSLSEMGRFFNRRASFN